MKTYQCLGVLFLTTLPGGAWAANNAPADAAVVQLRTSCTENGGAVTVPNCFDSIAALDNWLRNTRRPDPTRPTLVEIGPGRFTGGWYCTSSDVSLRGSGRDRTILLGDASRFSAIEINAGCTRLSVQDLTIDGRLVPWGVVVFNLSATTRWTNVELLGGLYAWVESINPSCPSEVGEHLWYSSRITATGLNGGTIARAYTATCATSWFWGTDLTTRVERNEFNAFALEAHSAEVHLYGSNAQIILAASTQARSYYPAQGQNPAGGHYLIAAHKGSSVHIHGTGLDVLHHGSGTADMLYADGASHFHANESGFNIHIAAGQSGKVRRLAGPGVTEAPYSWGPSSAPPLSATGSGVQALVSKNGADRYIETDCPLTGHCGSAAADKSYPHEMIYRAECTGTTANSGPWFDLTTKACRQ